MRSFLSIPRSFLAVWNALKVAAAKDREKRDFKADVEILDALRHADFNSHKYVITVFLKSGREIVGRIGLYSDAYEHDYYERHRGTLAVRPEREFPEGVSYELIEVKVSEIEGYLLQEVRRSSPQEKRSAAGE